MKSKVRIIILCLALFIAVFLESCTGFVLGRNQQQRQQVSSGQRNVNWFVDNSFPFGLKATEAIDICVIGGGVSGLSAALTAGQKVPGASIVLLEASDTVGGRVQSDQLESGYVLDRGFAVFIEEYPFAKQLLDYNLLKLNRFLPGALVKLSSSSSKLERVSDPLRVPGDLLTAILAPIGTLRDKINILPLIWHVRTKSIAELFEEPETNTLSALKERWGFSDDIIEKFFQPFLEGIYLAPLAEQSSRMFSFVFKMFSEGAATLPAGGIGAVSDQLAHQVTEAGVRIRTGQKVQGLLCDGNNFVVTGSDSNPILHASSVIVATDGQVSKQILSTLDSLNFLKTEQDQIQRSVGCLYYGFKGPSPVTDPILILNGDAALRGTESNPINNLCFPSVVSSSYAPEGHNLCSVTVLKAVLDSYVGSDAELDVAVRKQLASWFPDRNDEILNEWNLLRIYRITNAQPSQLVGPAPANVNNGRPSNTYRGVALPKGLFACGDHMSTATLNGALESGVQAGKLAASYIKT